MTIVVFRGGPWNGRLRTYTVTPRLVACKTDAEKLKIKGIYKQKAGVRNVMEWNPQ